MQHVGIIKKMHHHTDDVTAAMPFQPPPAFQSEQVRQQVATGTETSSSYINGIPREQVK
jgi:hypothetical protein